MQASRISDGIAHACALFQFFSIEARKEPEEKYENSTTMRTTSGGNRERKAERVKRGELVRGFEDFTIEKFSTCIPMQCRSGVHASPHNYEIVNTK